MSKEKTLIAMACYDTEQNERTKFTKATLNSLLETVDFNNNEFYIIDNNSCKETKEELRIFKNLFNKNYPKDNLTIITLDENIGTARAINLAIKDRKNRHVLKLDNDVVIEQKNWLEDIEFVVSREQNIGICALKRMDLIEHTNHPNEGFRSKLTMVAHNPGEKWFILEECKHIMGTCCMYTSELLSKINCLYQPSIYGFDDSIASTKSLKLGMRNTFLLGITIHHIDDGSNDYTKEKQELASQYWMNYEDIGRSIFKGDMPVWQDFY